MTESQTPIRRVVLASFIGTTIEWYDYFIYGTAAALVFNKLFFPTLDPFTGTIAAFGTFAVGFFARPIGGLVFGHYGDKLGRKNMLVTTLVMMGVATFLIGVLPTHAQIGVAAPALLVVLRFIQGFGVGGEWVSGECMLAGGAWARAHRSELLAHFPKVAVGKLAESELTSVRQCATFLRQFLRHFGAVLLHKRKSCGGRVERVYRLARTI